MGEVGFCQIGGRCRDRRLAPVVYLLILLMPRSDAGFQELEDFDGPIDEGETL